MFSWVTKDTTIDFMKARKFTYALSAVLMILSIASMAIKGFNYGIDFSGGILVELKSPEKINVKKSANNSAAWLWKMLTCRLSAKSAMSWLSALRQKA
jgi:preprotein translocase subunit SecF